MSLAEDLLNTIIPSDPKLSHDCSSVIYSTKPKWTTTALPKSSLWVAKTAASQSARQVTDGSNDRMATWSPNDRTIVFLSDRGSPGKACAIYHLVVDQGEPRAITPAVNLEDISKLEFGPDGNTIAYISPPEKEDNDVVDVWDQDWTYANLKVVDLESGSIRVLFDEKAHVADFCWDESGDEIAIATHYSPDLESTVLHGVTVSIVNFATANKRTVCLVPREMSNLTWAGPHLYFMTYSTISDDLSSQSVYFVGIAEHSEVQKVAHGEDDCAVGIIKVGKQIVVHVQRGMEDCLQVLNGDILYQERKYLLSSDVALCETGDFRLVTVGGSLNRPPEVFTITPGGTKLQLSGHGRAFEDRHLGHTNFIECQTTDGKEMLEGMFLAPERRSTDNNTPAKPLPTIVLVHGGPYWRITDYFDPMNVHSVPCLLERGWGILIPNYRGSSGRGDRFARYTGQSAGSFALSDVVAMTQHAIEKGYADKNHLIIAGHSQGGYLSYLSATRNGLHGFGWRFRAAIPIAGVTDSATMTMTSDIGYIQGNLGGGMPWKMDKDDLSTRTDSAIWEFKDAVVAKRIPPMLMLHGKNDPRVPISQAQGFRRALEEACLPFEFAAYPDEGHFFKKKTTAKDMMERSLRFINNHI